MSKASTDASDVDLPADLGIEHVETLKASLAEHVATANVSLGGAEVQRVHAASLQVLLSWFRLRDEAGLPTAWRAPSSRLTEACATVGATSLLHLQGNV